MSRSFITAAIARRHRHPQGPIANGDRCKSVFDLSPADPSHASAVKAAWLPTIAGQSVPIQGLERPHVPDCC